MRTRTTLLVLGLNAVPALCVAQHAHQFEIGAFGSFTRYDRAFGLDNKIGGGGRLGYFFSRSIGFELELGYQQPHPLGGVSNPALSLGSGSLALNLCRPVGVVVVKDHSASAMSRLLSDESMEVLTGG